MIELLTVSAVVGILLALALPSFNDAIARARISSQSNEFIATFTLAKVEAIRRNRNVFVCTTTDNLACGGGWDDGWMVWADEDADDAPDADEILRVGRHAAKDEAIAVDAVVSVGFSGRGRRTVPAGTDAFELTINPVGYDCDKDGVEMQRFIRVSSTGIVTATKLPACE